MPKSSFPLETFELGFGVWVWGIGFGVQGIGFMVQGF